MKVVYFTFLVLFLLNQPLARAACDFPNYKIQCASGPVCTSNKSYKCPEDTNTNYSNEGRRGSVTPATTSKAATPNASKSPAKSTSDSNSSQSLSDQTCGPKTYPGTVGCVQCPGNMTKVVNGKTYCSQESAQNEQNPCDEPDSQACIDFRNQACASGNQVWSQEQQTCISQNNAESSTQNSECEKQFADFMNKCIQEADSAMTSCNDNNEEMQAAENTAKLIGAGSVTSMQVACSKIGELSKFANGALSGWKVACSTNQGGCTESCTEAKRIINECMQDPMKTNFSNGYSSVINKNINQCESYKTKIAQAGQHAAAALAQLKASEQCKNDTSSMVNNAVDQCKTNPNSPLCKDMQKCSDANFAAQNPVCACASNPTSPSCLQASANYGSGSNSTGATLPGVGGGKNSSGLPGIAGGSNDGGQSTGLGTAGTPAADGHGVGGRQGDASSAGSLKNNAAGGPNGSGNHYGAGANGKDPLKVNSGTLGGTPGGPGYFGRLPGSSGNFVGNNAINANKGTLGKFDPRKYISGMGGKGEYINGANQNIFMIVKMRYEDKKTSLLPENFDLKK